MPEETIGTTPLENVFEAQKEQIEGILSSVFEEGPPKVQREAKPAQIEPKSTEKAPKPVQEEAKEPEKEESQGYVPEGLFEEKKEEKAPETPEKPVTGEFDEFKKGLKGPVRENFQKLEDKAHNAELKISEFEKKLAQAEERLGKGDPDAKAHIEELEKKLKTYESVVEKVSIELNPKFQNEILIPRQQALDYGKKTMAEAGLDPAQLEGAMAAKGQARAAKVDEILSEIGSEYNKGKINKVIEAIEQLDAAADYHRTNQKQYLEQSAKEEAANRHKAFSEYEKSTIQDLDNAFKVLAEEQKLIVFRKSDDPKAKEWNDNIDKSHDVAKMIMTKIEDRTQMAFAAELAAFFPMTYQALLKEREGRIKAETRLKDYQKSEPSIGAKRTNGSKPAVSSDPIRRAIDSVFSVDSK